MQSLYLGSLVIRSYRNVSPSSLRKEPKWFVRDWASIGTATRWVSLWVSLSIASASIWTALPAGAEPPGGKSDGSHEWAPPIADASESDWIRLTTGEWLKGTVKLIRAESVDFHSAQLDDLQIDWDDISEMRMPRAHTYRFTGRRIVTGVGGMRGDVIRIRVGDEVRQFKRKDFVSMIRGTGRELDYWSLNASLGLSGQAGNTDQLSFNGTLDVARETALTRGKLSYTGNVATQENDISANNHRANFEYDVYLTGRLYLVVPSVEVFQDEFQNIALRLTPGVGFGYDIIWSRKVKWQMGLSIGYQGTRYFSVSSGSDSESDVALQFNGNLDIDLPSRFEWTTSYQPQIVMSDIGKTSQHLSSTLSFDFWGPLDIDTTFQWDWVASPVADATTTVPESSDFRIIVGLALDL